MKRGNWYLFDTPLKGVPTHISGWSVFQRRATRFVGRQVAGIVAKCHQGARVVRLKPRARG